MTGYRREVPGQPPALPLSQLTLLNPPCPLPDRRHDGPSDFRGISDPPVVFRLPYDGRGLGPVIAHPGDAAVIGNVDLSIFIGAGVGHHDCGLRVEVVLVFVDFQVYVKSPGFQFHADDTLERDSGVFVPFSLARMVSSAAGQQRGCQVSYLFRIRLIAGPRAAFPLDIAPVTDRQRAPRTRPADSETAAAVILGRADIETGGGPPVSYQMHQLSWLSRKVRLAGTGLVHVSSPLRG